MIPVKLTERQMLDAVAKVYYGEAPYTWTKSNGGCFWNYIGWCDEAQLWNPLTCDADAFRLAVVAEVGNLNPIIRAAKEAHPNDYQKRMAMIRYDIVETVVMKGLWPLIDNYDAWNQDISVYQDQLRDLTVELISEARDDSFRRYSLRHLMRSVIKKDRTEDVLLAVLANYTTDQEGSK